jgi:uridine kinase
VEVPIYDFVTHSRSARTQPFPARKVILLDGTLILSQPEIVKLLDLSVFIDAPESVRYERRLKRDVAERGRTPEGVLKQFSRQVKPMHDAFVEPSKALARHIVSGLHSFEATIADWAHRALQD